MKMKNMFLAAMVLLSSCAYGQKEDFDKAVDFCNCKLTSIYLSNFAASLSSTEADKKSYEDIKNEFGKCEIGSAIEYQNMSDLLDNNNFLYSNAHFSKIINGVKSNYADNLDKNEAVNIIIKGIFENKSIEGSIKKYINADELKGELIKSITAYFEGKFKGNDKGNPDEIGGGATSITNELNDQIKTEVANQIQNINPDPWAFNYLSLIFIFIGLLLAFGIIKIKENFIKDTISELQQSRKEQRDELNSLKQTLDNNIGSTGTKMLTTFKNDWPSKIEEKILEANRAISKLDIALSMLRDEIEKGIITGSIFSNPPKVEQQSKPEILYASIPSKDGFFNENAISNTINPTASFYKLTITDSYGLKANFEFLGNDERAVKDATNAPERILRPACKINNALNQNAKRIKTIIPGIVIKQNGKWEIDTLAEIEYE